MNSKTPLGPSQSTEWERLATLLLHWSHYVMLGVRIRGSPVCLLDHGLPAIRGMSAEDFAYEVIANAIKGGIEPADGILPTLKDQVYRLVYQHARRKENHTLHPVSVEELSSNGSAENLADNCKTPSEETIEKEEAGRLVAFINSFQDEELSRYVQCIFEGVRMPKEFADVMSISVVHANYLKKKLRKKFLTFFADYDKGRLEESRLQFAKPLTRSN